MINSTILSKARQNLLDRAKIIESSKFSPVASCNFKFSDIKAGIRRKQLDDWLNQDLGIQIKLPTIYRITVDQPSDALAIRTAFTEIQRQSGIKLTRNNKIFDSETVYVGGSRSIVSRLSQHLVTAPHGTYALKMQSWCPDTSGAVNVEVVAILGDVTNSQRQDLEDALWLASKPMFGKMGGR